MRNSYQSRCCAILNLPELITPNKMVARNSFRTTLNYRCVKLISWSQCTGCDRHRQGRTKYNKLVAELMEIKFFWDASRYGLAHIDPSVKRIFLPPPSNWHGAMPQNTLIFIKMWMWISILFLSVYFPSVLPLYAFHLPFSLRHFISTYVTVAAREEGLQANVSFGSITSASHVKK